jgi:hypothetical protein
MVLAAKPNSEQVNNQLKDKKQKDQIRILKEFNLPCEVIALMIGTTYNTARVAISEMKSEKESENAAKSNIAKSAKKSKTETQAKEGKKTEAEKKVEP